MVVAAAAVQPDAQEYLAGRGRQFHRVCRDAIEVYRSEVVAAALAINGGLRTALPVTALIHLLLRVHTAADQFAGELIERLVICEAVPDVPGISPNAWL